MDNKFGIPIFFRYESESHYKMNIVSNINRRRYDADQCIYITNLAQAHKYLKHLGFNYLYDILLASTREQDGDCMVFVFLKCPETRKAKELWDRHEL